MKLILPDQSQVNFREGVFRFSLKPSKQVEKQMLPIDIEKLKECFERPSRKFADCFRRSSDSPSYSVVKSEQSVPVMCLAHIYVLENGESYGGMFSASLKSRRFLDGFLAEYEGYGFGSSFGTSVRGYEALRIACLFFGIKQPITLKGERARRPLAEILVEMSQYQINRSAFRGGGFPWSLHGEPRDILIPDSVTSIDDSAFRQCSGIRTVVIPASVRNIGSSAFNECSNLESIVVDPNNDHYSSKDGVLFDRNKMEIITFPCHRSGSYQIPSSVLTIKKGCFRFCEKLTDIVIPDSVTTIEADAFYCCTNLKQVQLPPAVRSIGEYAFHGCRILTQLKIPDNVSTIGKHAFSQCNKLLGINLPASLVHIHDGTFAGCISLTDVEFPVSIKTIGDKAFEYCEQLNAVVFPNGLRSIGANAFRNCSKLTNVHIPKSVNVIGDLAFRYCKNLTVSGIDSPKLKIGRLAFSR